MRAGLLIAVAAMTMAGCAGPAPAHDPIAGADPQKARKLYIAKCARCHKLYDPRAYSDDEWRTWMTKMSKKSRLNPAQSEELSRYIEENIRKPLKATNAPPLR